MTFRPNPGLAAQLQQQPAHRSALRSAAARIAQEAGRIAREEGEPWMERQGEPRVVVVDTDDGVAVVNTDHGGHLAEFGSKNNPPHAPLRRGVIAAGYQLEEH